MNTTILQATFYDGSTKTVEYEGDDLAGITQLLNKFKKKIIAVQMRVIDPKGKVVFDQSYNYAPGEIYGE